MQLRRPPSDLSRREAIRLSASALLTLGIWPGYADLPEESSAPFQFIAVNDTHHMSPECGTWLEKTVERMRQHKQAQFCLHAGDLTEHGERDHLLAVRKIFTGLGIPFHVQIGNHDYVSPTDRTAYEELFPDRLNYAFESHGWQFIGLDSTQGQEYQNTRIQPATFQWVQENLPQLDQRKPTVLFTHFPMGPAIRYRPLNTDDLLDHFKEFNLRTIFCGHFHGYTRTFMGGTSITTNRCCALKRGNHDGTQEKGYFLCTARDGRVERDFIELAT